MKSIHQQGLSKNRSIRIPEVVGLIVILFSILFSSGCAMWKKEKVDTEKLSAEALYGDAKEAILNERWAQSIEKLKALEARYPYGRFAKQAQLEIAFVQYKLGNDGLAIAAADRFISLNPTHSAVDYAYYIKGLANFQEISGMKGLMTGRNNLADLDSESLTSSMAAFGTIVQRFPNSQYVSDAKKRIAYLEYSRARHEVDVAFFYYQRRAYVAAVNRAKYILSNYGDLSVREDALGIMFHSYNEMKLYDLAKDTKRILSLNYPHSNYLKPDAMGKAKKSLVGRLLKF